MEEKNNYAEHHVQQSKQSFCMLMWVLSTNALCRNNATYSVNWAQTCDNQWNLSYRQHNLIEHLQNRLLTEKKTWSSVSPSFNMVAFVIVAALFSFSIITPATDSRGNHFRCKLLIIYHATHQKVHLVGINAPFFFFTMCSMSDAFGCEAFVYCHKPIQCVGVSSAYWDVPTTQADEHK